LSIHVERNAGLAIVARPSARPNRALPEPFSRARGTAISVFPNVPVSKTVNHFSADLGIQKMRHF
jgi:hypothetical protein